MDFVMMLVVAPAAQAQEVADAECPMDEWQGIEAAEVTPAMLAQISSALTGEALAEALDRCEPVAWGDSGACVLGLDAALGARLLDCADEALEELAEELAASEAFETAGWQAGEVYSLLVAMQDLATLASSDELLFCAWVRER